MALRREWVGQIESGPRLTPVLLMVASVCYSGSIIAARDLHDSFSPTTLVFLRCTLSAVLLAPFIWRDMVAKWPLLRRHWLLLVALAFTQAIFGQGVLYLGLQTTTAINVGLINTTMPFVALLISAVFVGERVSRRQLAGMLAAAVGVAVVVARGDFANLAGLRFHSGDLWVQAAMVSWGIYAVLVKKTPDELGILVAYLAMTSIAVLVGLPIYLWEAATSVQPGGYSWESLASVAFIATFGSLVALVFWNIGIKMVGAGAATAIVVLLQPVSTVLLAAALLGETIEPHHWWAGALILAGVFFGTMRWPRPS